MFKKIILPITAAAAMSLMACSSSPKAKVQADVSANNNPASATATDANATTGMTDEEIAAALAAQQAALAEQANGNASAESASAPKMSKPVPASCEIRNQTETALQMAIVIPDSGTVVLDVSLGDNYINNDMSVTFNDNISDDVIQQECADAKKDDSAQVTCEGKTITAKMKIEDPSAAMIYPMVSMQFQNACKDIQSTGMFSGFDGNTAGTETAPAAGMSIDCNVDMNSNEWTVNVNGVHMKYIFKDNVAQMITEIAQDVGSPEMCQMALNAAKQEDNTVNGSCDGSILKMLVVEDTDQSKAELYEAMKPFCPAK